MYTGTCLYIYIYILAYVCTSLCTQTWNKTKSAFFEMKWTHLCCLGVRAGRNNFQMGASGNVVASCAGADNSQIRAFETKGPDLCWWGFRSGSLQFPSRAFRKLFASVADPQIPKSAHFALKAQISDFSGFDPTCPVTALHCERGASFRT